VKAGRQHSHVRQLAHGTRLRAAGPLSCGIPSYARATAAPTRTGTGITLLTDIPGWQIMLKSTLPFVRTGL
jgi:hypothetical protein